MDAMVLAPDGSLALAVAPLVAVACVLWGL